MNDSSSSESNNLNVEAENIESESCAEDLNIRQDRSVPQDTEKASEIPATPVQEVPVVEKRQRRKPDRYGFANMCATTGDDELTYAEAISGPERQMWLQAMAEELQSFEDNQAWEVVDTPSNASVVQCKWVFKNKYDSDNKVRYRARLVAKGKYFIIESNDNIDRTTNVHNNKNENQGTAETENKKYDFFRV